MHINEECGRFLSVYTTGCTDMVVLSYIHTQCNGGWGHLRSMWVWKCVFWRSGPHPHPQHYSHSVTCSHHDWLMTDSVIMDVPLLHSGVHKSQVINYKTQKCGIIDYLICTGYKKHVITSVNWKKNSYCGALITSGNDLELFWAVYSWVIQNAC